MFQIPMSSPDLTTAEAAAVMKVLHSGSLSNGGQVLEFEQRFAERTGCEHAVAVSSGTAALHLAVIAAGITDNDFVITTPFSFIASANCLLYERAIPVFVDVDPLDGNIDLDQVEQAAADLSAGGDRAQRWLPRSMRGKSLGGRLKAILPVHVFGKPVDMSRITAVAKRHHLTVIEDACEAIGSSHADRHVGTWGDAGAFAFYPNKQVTTGEGGMFVTSNERWAQLARSLRNQGRDVFDAWLCHSRLGYNYRLTDLASALGIVQIERLDELLAKRARVAEWYSHHLGDHSWIALPDSDETMSWFVYVVRLPNAQLRDAAMRGLEAKGIPSRPYFTPIHLQPLYRERFGFASGDFPVTEWLGDCSLALPFSGVMTEAQVIAVCDTLASSLPERVRRFVPRPGPARRIPSTERTSGQLAAGVPAAR